jgi:hypothetical protein
MNLNEKNYVLAFALDDINYIVTENAGNNPGDIKKQYDCNKAAFDQIAKVIANAMRLDIMGGDLPEGTYFTPEAVRKFAEEQSKKDEGLSFEDAPNLNQILMNPPFQAEAELAKKRGLIGNCANNHHIMSWNYSDELDIVCRVVGDAEENNWWEFSLESLGLVRAHGTIHGGKTLAIRLAKAMRNGLTSFRHHRRKSHSNRAARKSAELAAAAKEEK